MAIESWCLHIALSTADRTVSGTVTGRWSSGIDPKHTAVQEDADEEQDVDADRSSGTS